MKEYNNIKSETIDLKCHTAPELVPDRRMTGLEGGDEGEPAMQPDASQIRVRLQRQNFKELQPPLFTGKTQTAKCVYLWQHLSGIFPPLTSPRLSREPFAFRTRDNNIFLRFSCSFVVGFFFSLVFASL